MSLLGGLPGPDDGTFDGESQPDRVARMGQMDRLYEVMKSGEWFSLAQLSAATRDPEASCSANFRSFRKEKHGSFQMDREKVSGRSYRYRMGAKGAGTPQKRQWTEALEALDAADDLIPYLEHKPACPARISGGACACGFVEARRAWGDARGTTRG